MKLIQLALLTAVAVFAQGANDPDIMWTQFSIPNPVNIPTVSDTAARHGVLVEVYTEDDSVDEFRIELRYTLVGNQGAGEQVRVQTFRRARSSFNIWTSEVIWTGQPVEITLIKATELKPARSRSICVGANCPPLCQPSQQPLDSR